LTREADVKRRYVRAGVAAAAVVLGVWVRAAEPGWVRVAGLDVWNAARLEAVGRDQQALSGRLDDELDSAAHRFRVNAELTRDVAAGHRTLAAAAALMWEANRDVTGFATALDVQFGCPTPVAGCARLLLRRVEQDGDAASRARTLDRLRAEYAAAFGVPAARPT
jgi:hypothetical protein